MPGPLSGLIPACYTPLGPDGRLNLSMVEPQARFLRQSGIDTVFVGGTTGEFASLSLAERMALVERWCEALGGALKVAVHVGHNCLPEAVALAGHARKAGAMAIATMAPSYFKPLTVGDLIDFCVPIAAEAFDLATLYAFTGPSGVTEGMDGRAALALAATSNVSSATVTGTVSG